MRPAENYFSNAVSDWGAPANARSSKTETYSKGQGSDAGEAKFQRG